MPRGVMMTAEVIEIWPQILWRELRETGDPVESAKRAGKSLEFLNELWEKDEKFRRTCEECMREWLEERRIQREADDIA